MSEQIPSPARSADPLRGRVVLLVEDNPADADLVQVAREEAGASFRLEHVERLEDALGWLSSSRADAVLLDLALPDAIGVEGVERLRDAFPELPILVLTGSSSSIGLEAVRAGAQDYLSKGEIDGGLLSRALGYAIERQRGVERARAAAAQRAGSEAARHAQEARAREHEARAHAAHRAQEFEALVASMVDAVVVYGEDRRIRTANPAAAALFGPDLPGLAPAEFVSRVDMRTPHGERFAPGTSPAERALAGVPATAERIRVRTLEGERALRVSSSPLLGERSVRGAVSVYRDVTEDERVLQALRESEERLRTVIEAIAEEVWVVDARGEMAVLNSASAPPLGVPELADRPLAELLAEVEILDAGGRPRAPEDAPLLRSLRGDVVRGEEIVRHLGTGRTRYRRFSSAPVRDAAGAITGAVAVVSDITERKAMEDALRAADERKNEFLAMLSHELRNPLAPIRNSIYILGKVAPGGEQARRAQLVIDRQVEHLTRLVDDLLDVTRITRGKIRLQREPFELNALVRRTAEDHASVFAAKQVSLEVSPWDRPLTVYGDATRIGQVIGNLLQNAVKFTPGGGATSVVVRASEDGFAAIHVRDTGAGIAPDAMLRMFEPFVQGESTLDRTRGGLGLGLALVKGLVELHGGRAQAHSAGAGRGAEFVVTLPVEPEGVRHPLEPAASGGAGAGRRILVIEDSADAAQSLKEALELNDHEVEVAATGLEGIEKARAFRPDVVLCDIGLPGIDGYDVARAMRADPQLRSLRLVALSGYAAARDLERAIEAGFDRHVAKPPSLDELERAIAEVARQHARGASPPA